MNNLKNMISFLTVFAFISLVAQGCSSKKIIVRNCQKSANDNELYVCEEF